MDRRGRLSRRANTRLEFKPAIIVLIIPCLDTRCLADISRRILDIRESPSSLIRERAKIEEDTLKQYRGIRCKCRCSVISGKRTPLLVAFPSISENINTRIFLKIEKDSSFDLSRVVRKRKGRRKVEDVL